MLLAAHDEQWDHESDDKENEWHEEHGTIDQENVVEEEGLRYFGGFIVHKFPQYQDLVCIAIKGNSLWVETINRYGGLMTHKENFLKQLKTMEKLFKIHHGNKELKAEKYAIKSLTANIQSRVKLPADIITYFMRCRMFFFSRIHGLNRILRV